MQQPLLSLAVADPAKRATQEQRVPPPPLFTHPHAPCRSAPRPGQTRPGFISEPYDGRNRQKSQKPLTAPRGKPPCCYSPPSQGAPHPELHTHRDIMVGLQPIIGSYIPRLNSGGGQRQCLVDLLESVGLTAEETCIGSDYTVQFQSPFKRDLK